MSFPPPFEDASSRADLAVLAEVAGMRFPIRAAEARRQERFHSVLDVAAELSSALAEYTRHARATVDARVDVPDLAERTGALADALDRYLQLVHEVAAEYRRYTLPLVVPPDLVSETGRPMIA